jgi:hypothetical protein
MKLKALPLKYSTSVTSNNGAWHNQQKRDCSDGFANNAQSNKQHLKGKCHLINWLV